ncbi:2-phospho-L-lactate guanylyltransferase [Kineosporia sp. J2-2]|uniref:Phosphoenolpyruvate guanylyltransferase n=1 Tax=Kineosporia corallincola TaxID=2835133 RepID=A0ABS5TFA3_9ACTN|nr:2-phospho-L-lactate guanylyltransferase [Kineosporia corallincola]MBT0769767.1 2-phospho-L-lactate guanylyltransferase [Kineosporia corallincola]
MIEDVAGPGTRGVSPGARPGSGHGHGFEPEPPSDAQRTDIRPTDARAVDARWTVVLPFKGGPQAKSRLSAGSRPAGHTGLASAIALDCLDAVLAARLVGQVVVVTADPALAVPAAAAGAVVRPETRPGTGLLAAIADGLAGLEGPCAVLLGDLPALRPAELDQALQTAWETLTAVSQRPGMAFVPDADGIGTVLLAAAGPAAMVPSFGPESARLHAASGARRLDLDLPTLRRDVDTPADLARATEFGLGPRTRAVLALG